MTQTLSNKPIDDQNNNFLKTSIKRNLLTDGQIYTPNTAALLWHCVFILLHFKAAVRGCWVLALSKWNKNYVVTYVRQLKQRIPGLTCLPFQSGGSVKTNGAGEVGGPAQGGTGCFCFCPNLSAVLLHFWRLMSGCFCTSQMQKEFIFASKTKTKTQSKTLQQLFFNANACLFHALKPFSPGCLWQTFHNRLFKVWHMCQC